MKIEDVPEQYRRSSHEERGLKFGVDTEHTSVMARRSSHEERGLKSATCSANSVRKVAPRMRSVD